MIRNKASISFAPAALREVKNQVLGWAAARPGTFLFLDSNEYPGHGGYELLAGVGTAPGAPALSNALPEKWPNAGDWLMGHLGYDLRTQLEPRLTSHLPPLNHFPPLHFFTPRTVFYIRRHTCELVVETIEPDAAGMLKSLPGKAFNVYELPVLQFEQAFTQGEYEASVRAIQQHIRRGDCYELNFCAAAFCQAPGLHPVAAFAALNAASPSPFAACYRHGPDWLLCASPERYLTKKGNMLSCHPIKGTIRRGANAEDDAANAAALQHSEKDKAEHVMIADLARNDLARCCMPGSIAVPRLMALHTFPQVHHLISTITGRLMPGYSLADALRATFPVGSMTGMPKIKVMELTEQYERHRRGLFSGSVGYVSPGGDADFNVVIRSLFFSAKTQLLSYQTGGAITADSNATEEWAERLLKAAAMERVFADAAQG